jgi:hypothetical protein
MLSLTRFSVHQIAQIQIPVYPGNKPEVKAITIETGKNRGDSLIAEIDAAPTSLLNSYHPPALTRLPKFKRRHYMGT